MSTSSLLVRSATDQAVLDAVIAVRSATRAGLAELASCSKPTASAAVSRLIEQGILVETGQHTVGRGRAGALVGLNPGLPVALCVDVAPDGVRVQAVSLAGDVESDLRVTDVSRPDRALARAVGETASRLGTAISCAAVSVADPVDRATGRAVRLPDEPFLVGELDSREILRSVIGRDVAVQVDNDVNWAARALAQ